MAKVDLLEKMKKEGGTLPPSRVKIDSINPLQETGQKEKSVRYFRLPEELGSKTEELNGVVLQTESDLQQQNMRLDAAAKRVHEIQEVIKLASSGNLPLLDIKKMNDDLLVAQTGYLIAVDKGKKAAASYNSAVDSYNSYVGQQREIYDQWRGTIRTPEQIQPEVQAVDQQIQQLMKRYPALKTEGRSSKWEEYMAIEKADQEMVDAARKLEALKDKKALLQEEQDMYDYFRYEDLRQAEDFAQKSQYTKQKREEKTGKTVMKQILSDYSDEKSGWEDPLYEAVNGNEEARAYLRNQGAAYYGSDNPLGSLLGRMDKGKTEAKEMTPAEVEMFNYLYATQGKEAAHGYYNYLQSSLNERHRKAMEAAERAHAQEKPVLASIESLVTSPLKGISFAGQISDYIVDGVIDQNAGYNAFSYMPTATRSAVSDKIAQSGEWGEVGSFAYNTVMSRLDSLLNTAIGGGNKALSLTIMGSGVAADQIIEAKDRGLSDDQAILLGIIAGVAEALTENMSIDALLNKTGMGKSAVGYILQNSLAEGFEEGGSNLINTMADLLISKNKSQWVKSIDAYKEQGLDDGAAFANAMADQAASLGLDVLGGMLSGGGTGAVSAAGSAISAASTGAQIGKQNLDVAQVQDMVNFGLQAEAGSRANYLAQQFQQKLARGEALSDYDLGRLTQANVQAIEQGMLEGVSLEQMMQRADELARVRGEAAQQTSAPQVATNQMSAQEQEAAAQRLSNLFGRKIVLVSEAATENGIRNGWTQDGVLYVNTQSGDPFARIVGHELTHNTEHADVYNQISGTVLRKVAASGTDLRQRRAQIKALYAANGEQLTDVQVDQEIVADYIGQYLFTDEASITELTKEKPSAGRRILQWLDQLLAKLGNADAQERAFLNRARNLYAKALQQTQSSFPEDGASASETLEWAREAYANGEMTEEEFDSYMDQIIEQEEMENAREPAEVKHSYAGPKAAGADLDALARAKEMEAQGVAAETIRQDTGWHKGKDGQWRWEFSDRDLRFDKTGDLQGATSKRWAMENLENARDELFGSATLDVLEDVRAYNRADIADNQEEKRRLYDKISSGTYAYAFTQYTEALENAKQHRNGSTGGTLADYVDHPVLFENYPQLRDTGLRFEAMKQDTGGYYSRSQNEVVLNEQLIGEPENVLIHEIQHAIQAAEGFARGASPEYWQQIQDGENPVKQYDNQIREAESKMEQILQELPDNYAEQFRKYADLDDIDSEQAMEYAEDLARGPYAEQFNEFFLLHWGVQEMRQNNYKRGPRSLYRDTAGEIEARDAAARRNLTTEERKNTPPEIGDVNTVIVEDSVKAYQAIGRTVDNKPFVTITRDILAGVPTADWVRTVKTTLRQKFPLGITVRNNQIRIDRQSRREITYSGYSQWLKQNDPQAYADKLRATDNADEILIATTDWINEGLNHPRTDNIVDFSRGNLLLRVGTNDYSAEVVVALENNGSMKLYDILRLQPTNIIEKEIAEVKAENPSPGADRNTTVISNESIRQDEAVVKRKYSIGPNTVNKQGVISDLRGILQRGGDPAELRQYVTGLEQNNESAEQSGGFAEHSIEKPYRNNVFAEQSARETEQILRSAKRQGISVSQYLQENWERYEVDGQWSAAAKRALDQERNGRRHSISAPEASENSAPDLQKSYENVNLAEDSNVYSYQFLTSQPDMQIVTLPEVDSVRDSDGKIDTAKVVEAGMKNALSVGTEKAGNIYVPNRYTGRELRVTAGAIRHGLNGAFNRRLTNARIGAVIGEIVHNAIPINALYNTAEGVVGTYAMIGYAKDSKGREFVAVVTVEQRENAVSSIDLYDVTHAISGRQKRNSQPVLTASEGEIQADTESQGFNLIKDSSEISIAGLLETVKNVYQSILSNDVLQGLGETRNPKGHYTGRAKFSLSPNPESGLRLPTLEEAEAENLRSMLPAKARNALQRIERTLTNKLGDSLSVPWLARREYLRGTVQQIADSYLRTGTVEQELINQLFEDAYQQGIVVDSEFYDAYKHIKKHLQTTPVTISAQDQEDIPDFHLFRTEANKYKTLRIVSEGGMPVDSYYRELQEMAPELFPERITHPADQLQRMYDVAKSIRITESSLKEYYGSEAEDFRQFAKHDFQVAVEETFQDLRNIKRYLDEVQAEAEKAPATEQEAAEAWAQLKESRKAYEKAMAKNLLTNHDEAVVGDLLRGKISLEHLDPETENVKGITAVYEAKKEYERWSKLLAEYKSQHRAERFRQADGYLETANEWKDKKAGILYSRETMTRNIEDIVPDKALAKKILREYIEPVAVAEAAAARFKEEYRGKVRELNLSRKVVKGNLVSEAHAVQLLGEAMDNIRVLERAGKRLRHRDGKTLDEWRAVVQDLWKENPKLDQKKIQDAVESFRKIYDELFQQMNAVRIRFGYEPVNYRQGYFPHFQPGDGDGILAHFGKVMGIDTSVTALPTTINGLTHTFKPGIQWFGNAQERLGFNTAYDAVEGFDKYIEGVASVIHQTENIQKLRALASRVRYRTSDEGLRKQVDAVLESDRLTEEEKQAQIAEIYSKGKFTLSNFVVELDEYTNILANKKSKLDRTVEALMGRRIYTLMKWWEGRVGANMIAGNLSSAMTNFIPLTQAGAQMGRGNLLRGMWSTLRAIGKHDGFVNTSDFLTNRHGSDPLVQTWVQKGSNIAGKPMELIDSFVSESIVRGAYLQNLKRGLSETEAMHQADLFVARVMADRSKGAMPTLFASSNPLFKAFTQFQLEVNNQFSEVFKDLPRGFKEKSLAMLAWVLLKYFLGAFLFNELFEYFFGRRPALDPLGIINDTVGDFTGYELPNLIELGGNLITGEEISFESQKVGVGTGVKNLANNVLEELPFSSGLTLLGIETDGGRLPASSAVPDLTALWDAATTEGWSGKKRLKEAWDELQKPLTYIVPPFGGNQVAKTWKGLAAYFRGGSYNVNKDGENFLQYPVFKDDPDDAFWNLVRTAIMGKSSLPEAQDWVESGFDSLGTQQTVAYQDMVDAGVNDREAYALIRQLEQTQKTEDATRSTEQRKVLRGSEISAEGKAIAYYGLIATDRERELMDRLTDAGADSGQTVQVVMDLQDLTGLTGQEKKTAQRDILAKAPMTDDEKSMIVEDLLGSDMMTAEGNPTQYAKFLCATQTGLDVDGFMDLYAAGCDMDDYFGFTDAGLSSTEAKKLTLAMKNLQPEDGADKVTSVQKWRVAADGAADKMGALAAVMSDDQYAKVEIANSFGVDPEDYITLQEIRAQYDTDGNGSYTQAETKAAIDTMDVSIEQKAVLWQLATGSTSAKNNPYRTAIGSKVLAAKQEAKAAAEEPEQETLSFSEEIMRQLTGG